MVRRFHINLDNTAIAYMTLCIISVLRTSEMHFGSIAVFKMVSFICTFIIARTVRNKSWILSGGAMDGFCISDIRYINNSISG